MQGFRFDRSPSVSADSFLTRTCIELQSTLSSRGCAQSPREAGHIPLTANNPGGTAFDSSVVLTIAATKKERFLSFASMLICTNDGFTGLDSRPLPSRKGKTTTVFTAAYDARTEMNTEDFADMVPPCQGLIGVSSVDSGTGASDPALAETGIAIPHPGIIGGEDLLPGVHGWSDPVTRVEIERTR